MEVGFFPLVAAVGGEEGLVSETFPAAAFPAMPAPHGSEVLLLMLLLPLLVLMADKFPSLVMEGSEGFALVGLLPLASTLALFTALFFLFLARALTKSASRQESSVTISESNPPSSELPVLVLWPPMPLGGLTEAEAEALLAEEVSPSSIFASLSGGSSTRLVYTGSEEISSSRDPLSLLSFFFGLL